MWKYIMEMFLSYLMENIKQIDIDAYRCKYIQINVYLGSAGAIL